MKTPALLALAVLGAATSAQMGPPPGGRGGPGGPPSSASSRPTSSGTARTETARTETIRLLTLTTVQKDLNLTGDEYSALVAAAKSLKGGATEDAALAAVSKLLTADQATRLKELLVQDLGYGALELADVRSALSLTADQETAVTGVVSSYVTSTQALATANPASAQAERAKLQTQAMASLAKLLTAEQDAKLRSLAGRALGA